LKSIFINEKTLDGAYFKILYELYHNGRKNKIDSGSYEGCYRLEGDFVAGSIEFPTTRPLAPQMPEGVPPTTTDNDILNYFVNYIMDGENLKDNEHYRYATWINGGKYKIPQFSGEQLIGTTGTRFVYSPVNNVIADVPSQVEWIIKHYKEKGFGNNHCFIQIGYPESSFAYDIPYENDTDRQTSPCLRGIDTHIKDNKLHASVYFRSWDAYGAWPENMGGIVLLMEYIANSLAIETGPLSFASLKLHCYDFQIDALKARLMVD